MIDGKKIKKLRTQLGVSQNLFAHMCRIPRSSIAEIEQGRRHSSKYLAVIADHLGVSVDEIIAKTRRRS